MNLRSAINFVHRSIPMPLRRSVDSFRPLPNFLIIGAMKGGTTSLHEHLIRHPQVGFSRIKEVHYFTQHHARGERFYRSNFPLFPPREGVVGEATPAYLFHPQAPARIKALLPNIRMIALLRDPVERAISQYFHSLRANRESLPIADAMNAEDERIGAEMRRAESDLNYSDDVILRFSYKRRGHYLEQLERYWRLFPKERLLILRSEDFFADPTAALSEICTFLEIPNRESWGNLKALNVGENRREVPDAVRAELRRYFAPLNRQLEDALGRKMNWD